jgi:formamidopyrimidine-DNA glycosylase
MNFSRARDCRDTGEVPEILEVEMYRRSVLDTVGHRITDVEALDARWCARAPDARERLIGCRITDVRRHGKVLLIETDGPTAALRFGMTGRLVVSGRSAVTDLAYGAHGDDPRWTRLSMTTTSGRRSVTWEISDPRRLGWLELDPDLSRLGPDVWDIDPAVLVARVRTRTGPAKSVLLDQTVVAGFGNMLADEVLLRASIDPTRQARSLSDDELQALATATARALPEMLNAGGSHRGLLAAELRIAGAPCPLDGAPLTRAVIGGRATYWCPVHQR